MASFLTRKQPAYGPQHRRLFAQGLPHRQELDRSVWHSSAAQPPVPLESIVEALHRPALIPKPDFFKQEERKLIFRFREPESGRSFLVKAFRPLHWRKRLTHRSQAYAEAVNLLQARGAGLPVPAVHAYGYTPGVFGAAWRAVVMEFLDLKSMRDFFVGGAAAEVLVGLMDRAIPLIRRMYEAGCCHCDFGPHAVMLHPTDALQDRLIDFQFSSFCDRPVAESVAFMAGYFGWAVATNRHWLTQETVRAWYGRLLDQLALKPNEALTRIFESHLQQRASNSERLGLVCRYGRRV